MSWVEPVPLPPVPVTGGARAEKDEERLFLVRRLTDRLLTAEMRADIENFIIELQASVNRPPYPGEIEDLQAALVRQPLTVEEQTAARARLAVLNHELRFPLQEEYDSLTRLLAHHMTPYDRVFFIRRKQNIGRLLQRQESSRHRNNLYAYTAAIMGLNP
jgi:hypothetical protein